MATKNVNGVDIAMTPDEEAAHLADLAANDPTNWTPIQRAARAAQESQGAFSDRKDRVLFEILFTLWNGERARQSLAPLTRAQFRGVLRDVWRDTWTAP